MTRHTCACGRRTPRGERVCKTCQSRRLSTRCLKGIHAEMRGGGKKRPGGRVFTGQAQAYLDLVRALVAMTEEMGHDPGDLFTPDELELIQRAAEARAVEREPRYAVHGMG